jgi:hypothetical protein
MPLDNFHYLFKEQKIHKGNIIIYAKELVESYNTKTAQACRQVLVFEVYIHVNLC